MQQIKDITLIASLTTILFVQEQALSFLPNIQLTVFLILLYSKVLGLKKTIIIVFLHTTLDNLVMGSFNLVYYPCMLIAWSVIPLITSTCLKKCENSFVLALFGIVFSIIYSYAFLIPSVILLEVNVIDYIYADLIFQLLLALSSFVSILWLYKPLKKVLLLLNNKEENNYIEG